MGRKGNSNTGAALVVLAAVVYGILSSLSDGGWLIIFIVLAVAIVIYAYGKSKRAVVTCKRPTAPTHGESLDATLPRMNALSNGRAKAGMPNFAQDESEPKGIVPASGPPISFKIPKAPKGFGAAEWIPEGRSVTVANVTIPGGLIYVGTFLPTPSGGNDPGLIDPSKPAAKSGDFTVRQMDYWPSYSEITPTARRAYLDWLAEGRKDPKAEIGFVFLFFYGLERRAIIDGVKDEITRDEWPVVAEELRRLLSIYGDKSRSFRSYASGLLDWLEVAVYPPKLYERPVPAFPKSYELPMYIRLALGLAAVDEVPVPTHLALAWARLDPNVHLRTAATRCVDEFQKSFALKYAELCGDGIRLPKNRTRLKLVYRPASAGFRGYGDINLHFNDTPDVSVLTAPVKALQEVVEEATKPLDAYSRLLGKNKEARASLEGIVLLPVALWPNAARGAVQGLRERIGDGMIAIPFQELLDTIGATTAFTRDKMQSLARALEGTNIGFEPDVLSGAKPPKPDDKVVLFFLPALESGSRTKGAYLIASVTLQLASAVAHADGEFGPKEIRYLRESVQSWTHLSASEIRRLLAHLRLLMLEPVTVVNLKKRLEPLSQEARETIATFMTAVAQSDGDVSPAEIKMLEKVYRALGVEAKEVFSNVHKAAVRHRQGHATASSRNASEFTLDAARIAELQKDTERVSAILADVFNEVETHKTVPVEEARGEAVPNVEEEPAAFLGLDGVHVAFARLMLSRPEWTREELMDVADDLNLMLDGALEHINDAAFDVYGAPLFEGDDPVLMNSEILERLEA